MANGIAIDDLRQSLEDPHVIAGDPFGLLSKISNFSATHQPEEAKELVLRALDKQDLFAGCSEILSGLVRQTGLFPYLDPSTLGEKDLLAFEFHRPLGLNDDVVFHSVQARVYRELLANRNVILSAPTSFGKSLIIDALIASGKYENIVIVVPTIALIDETRRRLSKFSEQFKIATHVSQALAERNVLILTQERVVDHKDLPAIDLFVVDEFYKLSPSLDQERSALLNQAFYKLFKTGAQFYLLGPDIRELPAGLPERISCLYMKTDYATVVSETHRVNAKDDREEMVRLCSELEEPTLIFCRSPKRVRDVATWLVEEEIDGRPENVDSAVEWMGLEYHPDWLAARALSRGIAMHHGRMPRALSQFMVRCFNEGRAKFLVCTSTLIEGVNTKAKNVIVLDNKIATRKYDYFTFNNIRGRSGRMFEHFVGRVFLFHDPPQAELPLVDVPVLTQPDTTPTSLLVQIEEVDLAEHSRQRLSEIWGQEHLDLSVIRENSGIDPDGQIAMAEKIRNDSAYFHSNLSWAGLPTYNQLKFACEQIWENLRLGAAGKAGIYSGSQLTFKINQFRANPEIPTLIAQEIDKNPNPDDAVEAVLEFLRQWASFEFPRLLLALDRIQRSVFVSLGMAPGDYSMFAARIEGLMMPPPLAALDEYGIPIQTARKLEAHLQPSGDLDEVLARLKLIVVEQLDLHPFEREVVSDAQKFL